MRSHLWSGLGVSLVLSASLLAGTIVAAADELTVKDIVERLKVPGDEVTFRTRGLRPSTPAPDEPNGGQISDMKILFEFNSDILTAAAKDELDKYGEALKLPALENESFQITGHTDAVGGDRYNLSLSERRAASVVDYLNANHGIPSDRLTPKGYGESHLADPSDPRSGENRRVEIINTQLLY